VTNISERDKEAAKCLINKYTDSLKSNLDRGFKGSLPVLTVLLILDPLQLPNKNHPGFKLYDRHQVRAISSHFSMNCTEEEKAPIIQEKDA